MFIYLLTNSINGKRYVGQTNLTPEERFEAHVYASRSADRVKTSAIGAAIAKHGRSAFSVCLLERCSTQLELDEAEIRWIATLGTQTPGGYNIRLGGKGGRLSQADREKLSIARKGTKQNLEWIERRIAPLRGRKRPPEICKALSLALKGRKNVWGHKVAATKKANGYKPSAEHIAKFNQAGREKIAELRSAGEISTSGANNPKAKLSWAEVAEIRALYASGSLSQMALAEKFGVKQVAISRIVRIKTWVPSNGSGQDED